ncbi:MAG: hypothetical protein CMN30_34115 [Sandaracinus sp.]|nr:hypothetical protein [Sandaracinus sp.]|tara:strand:- start:1886 stop:2527 length:642 start_codon:yes stop_codon:yes gene_type:complete
MTRSLLALALVALAATTAAADDGDGLYDRFDRDLTLAMNVGGGVVLAGGDARPTLAADLRLRVIDTAGPVVAMRYGSDGRTGHGHVLVGVELRPFFPALFLLDLSTGNEWVDLFVQSFGIELGAALFPFDDDFGVGLGVGLSIELPLLMPSRTSGTFQSIALRLAARRIDGTPSFRATPDQDRSEWTLMATLSFALSARAGIADWEPVRYRLD